MGVSVMRKIKKKLENKINKYQKMLDIVNEVPKSWCIELDEHNFQLLGMYFKGNAGYFKQDFVNVTLFSSGNLEFKTKKLSNNTEYYKKITTEDFEKYILKL